MKPVKALLTAIGVYVAVSGIIYNEAMNRNGKLLAAVYKMQNKKHGTVSEEDERIQWTQTQSFESHTIQNKRGQKLQGWYLPADTPSDRFVLCSHGYRSTGKREFRYLSKFYHDAGFNLLLVDHVASGDSEGSFISFGYHEASDLVEWMDYLLRTFGKDIQIVLQGMSMGSSAVLMLAGSPDLPENVKFAVSDCGYSDMKAELSSALKSAKVPAHPIVDTADFIQKTFFGFPFEAVRPMNFVRQSQIPVLFIHGDADQLVSCAMSRELYEACTSEKDLLIVPGALHTMCYPTAPEAYAEKVLSFCEKYLEP